MQRELVQILNTTTMKCCGTLQRWIVFTGIGNSSFPVSCWDITWFQLELLIQWTTEGRGYVKLEKDEGFTLLHPAFAWVQIHWEYWVRVNTEFAKDGRCSYSRWPLWGSHSRCLPPTPLLGKQRLSHLDTIKPFAVIYRFLTSLSSPFSSHQWALLDKSGKTWIHVSENIAPTVSSICVRVFSATLTQPQKVRRVRGQRVQGGVRHILVLILMHWQNILTRELFGIWRINCCLRILTSRRQMWTESQEVRLMSQNLMIERSNSSMDRISGFGWTPKWLSLARHLMENQELSYYVVCYLFQE